MDGYNMGRTHCSLQDSLELMVSSMFTVPNVFGAWHRAWDIITKQVIAIKLEHIMDKLKSYLEHEYTVLNQLQGGNGVLWLSLWFRREGLYRARVFEVLCSSLDKLIQASPDGIFGLEHVIELGLQIVSSWISRLKLSDPWSLDILSQVHPFPQLHSPWHQTPEHPYEHHGIKECCCSCWLQHCKTIPQPIIMHPYSNERILSTCWYAGFYIYQ